MPRETDLLLEQEYGNKVMGIRGGDLVFLYNLDTDVLHGGFVAESDGFYSESEGLFDGKYPYQVKVIPEEPELKMQGASRVLKKLRVNWRDILSETGAKTLLSIMRGNNKLILTAKPDALIDDSYLPPVFSTTLWDYPTQSYGDIPKGNNKYPGVTPAFIIYNMIHRYTNPGDIVLDPMAGSGTTIDVCKGEKRRVVALDIVPVRKDIIQADARNLPLKDEIVDMVFVDSPYGDNIRYNEHPQNIGRIAASEESFYDELEEVMAECFRVIKKGRYLSWLIGDQWAKRVFVPVGFLLYQRLTKYFEPVDIVCVARRNQSSNTPFWHSKAIAHNFFLRGFKYLILVRKPDESQKRRKTMIKWRMYER